MVDLDLKNQVLGSQVCAVKLGISESELYLADENNMETRKRQEGGTILEIATWVCSRFQRFGSDHLI